MAVPRLRDEFDIMSTMSTVVNRDPGRNLILCFDGTTNKFGEDRLTNVVRIFELLRKDSPEQICYYQPGIGTYDAKVPLQNQTTSLSSKLSMAADAIFANGIKKHILGGYRFLMTHYHSGDQIYMFGFSRGAYTTRALCGMLEKVGLLSFGNDEQVEFAWRMYKQKDNDKLAKTFREVFCGDVQVYFLGLWDTVKSTRNDFLDPQKDSFVFHVYHALALDERRVNFSPHRYCKPSQQRVDTTMPATDIKERWFVGDHSDVGGRFKFTELGSNALANPSFRWIVWAAACASDFNRRPLLFNLRAFHKYFKIIFYSGHEPGFPSDQNESEARQKILNVKYFRDHSPEYDSRDALSNGNRNGRPNQELESIKLDINNTFRAPSIWPVAQMLRGRNPLGNARMLSNHDILHASVRGKINQDPKYGGKEKRINMLGSRAAKADENILLDGRDFVIASHVRDETDNHPHSPSLSSLEVQIPVTPLAQRPQTEILTGAKSTNAKYASFSVLGGNRYGAPSQPSTSAYLSHHKSAG